MLPLYGRRSLAAHAAPLDACPWTRAAPDVCRDPRRRSWTRRPGCPCGRACEELPAAWTRRRSCHPSRRAIHPAAILDTSPAAPAPGSLLPNWHDGPRRAPAAPATVRDPRHAAPRPWTRGPAPRPAPSRGRYAPQDATPTGLLLPRNAQRQRATHPRTPAPPRHAPRAPARPALLSSRHAAHALARACTRAPAFACRYCARHFPLSRAL